MIGQDELVRRFQHHKPTDEQIGRISVIRTLVLSLALSIDDLCPDSREKSDALTNLDYVLSQSLGAIMRRE